MRKQNNLTLTEKKEPKMNAQNKFRDKKFQLLYRKTIKHVLNHLGVITPNSDIDIYISFVNIARKFVNLEEEETINIWHIEQNNIKNKNTGRVSIKNLCMHYFYNLQSEIDYLERTKGTVL